MFWKNEEKNNLKRLIHFVEDPVDVFVQLHNFYLDAFFGTIQIPEALIRFVQKNLRHSLDRDGKRDHGVIAGPEGVQLFATLKKTFFRVKNEKKNFKFSGQKGWESEGEGGHAPSLKLKSQTFSRNFRIFDAKSLKIYRLQGFLTLKFDKISRVWISPRSMLLHFILLERKTPNRTSRKRAALRPDVFGISGSRPAAGAASNPSADWRGNWAEGRTRRP